MGTIALAGAPSERAVSNSGSHCSVVWLGLPETPKDDEPPEARSRLPRPQRIARMSVPAAGTSARKSF